VLNQDFKEFVQSLNDSDVRYLVIGAYAVALHGYPRYTGDIGIWIDMARDNAEKMVEALGRFGFDSLRLQVEDFLVPEQVIQLGHPPNRIDIITSPPGVTFPECCRDRVDADIDGVRVSFIDRENLMRTKRASGRPQDLADLENLR